MIRNNDLVFVVDDNPLITMLVEEILKAEGYENIETFQDPDNLLQEINATKIPSVVISDYRMPQMTGIQLLEKIRHQYNNINSVIITVDPTEVEQTDEKQYKVIDKSYNLRNELMRFLSQVTEDQMVAYH